jgi:hypothetical protein
VVRRANGDGQRVDGDDETELALNALLAVTDRKILPAPAA